VDQELRDRIYKMTKQYAKMMTGDDTVEVRFSRKMRTFVGGCYHDTRTIVYGTQFCEANAHDDEALRWVVVHECAHLKHNDHGHKFNGLCTKHGVDPDGYSKGTIIPRHYREKFSVKCPSCGFSKKYFKECRTSWKKCPECDSDMKVRKLYPKDTIQEDDASRKWRKVPTIRGKKSICNVGE
jgi:hypothetical protein